ncbi:MAG: hypothetical protein QG574_4385 [Cyanobacteriota bacterium erpe_2018_sw_21hr_WHONDRS-SW48-000092_B_bin.40]|nr:hypothetical protein [Cyanobacteriota bacterium erpe_2018_sw_21hr_WHONDRS-SW48-000092_B_bin.40]
MERVTAFGGAFRCLAFGIFLLVNVVVGASLVRLVCLALAELCKVASMSDNLAIFVVTFLLLIRAYTLC